MESCTPELNSADDWFHLEDYLEATGENYDNYDDKALDSGSDGTIVGPQTETIYDQVDEVSSSGDSAVSTNGSPIPFFVDENEETMVASSNSHIEITSIQVEEQDPVENKFDGSRFEDTSLSREQVDMTSTTVKNTVDLNVIDASKVHGEVIEGNEIGFVDGEESVESHVQGQVAERDGSSKEDQLEVLDVIVHQEIDSLLHLSPKLPENMEEVVVGQSARPSEIVVDREGGILFANTCDTTSGEVYSLADTEATMERNNLDTLSDGDVGIIGYCELGLANASMINGTCVFTDKGIQETPDIRSSFTQTDASDAIIETSSCTTYSIGHGLILGSDDLSSAGEGSAAIVLSRDADKNSKAPVDRGFDRSSPQRIEKGVQVMSEECVITDTRESRGLQVDIFELSIPDSNEASCPDVIPMEGLLQERNIINHLMNSKVEEAMKKSRDFREVHSSEKIGKHPPIVTAEFVEAEMLKLVSTLQKNKCMTVDQHAARRRLFLDREMERVSQIMLQMPKKASGGYHHETATSSE